MVQERKRRRNNCPCWFLCILMIIIFTVFESVGRFLVGNIVLVIVISMVFSFFIYGIRQQQGGKGAGEKAGGKSAQEDLSPMSTEQPRFSIPLESQASQNTPPPQAETLSQGEKKEVRYCPYCGSTLKRSTERCNNCGSPIDYLIKKNCGMYSPIKKRKTKKKMKKTTR